MGVASDRSWRSAGLRVGADTACGGQGCFLARQDPDKAAVRRPRQRDRPRRVERRICLQHAADEAGAVMVRASALVSLVGGGSDAMANLDHAEGIRNGECSSPTRHNRRQDLNCQRDQDDGKEFLQAPPHEAPQVFAATT